VVTEQAFWGLQLSYRAPQIVVSAEQADEARDLLAELDAGHGGEEMRQG
jgi:hypothetical protein